jgi:hypothetical protein
MSPDRAVAIAIVTVTGSASGTGPEADGDRGPNTGAARSGTVLSQVYADGHQGEAAHRPVAVFLE